MGQSLVLGLLESAAVDRRLVGGKAATLGVLAAAGFPVPPAFVVTAAAPFRGPGELAMVVAHAVEELGPGSFAVRSSAAAEDLPEASYAGLYETYLGVDPAGVLSAVESCRASAATERVSTYRGIRENTGTAADRRGRHMAVLVQQMVDAAAAGVVFTADPLTGDRDRTVVTAVPGLGESLVSGDDMGEQWTVTGGCPELTRADPAAAVLTGAQVLDIAALATRVAHRFDRPQDIEWAIDRAGRLWLLQARPMTALPDPVGWPPPGPGLWMRNFRLGEWLPEAMTPLFADWAVPGIEAGFLDGMRVTVRIAVPFRCASVNGWYFNAAPTPTPRLLLAVLRQGRGHAVWFLFNALARVSRNPAAADRAVLAPLERQWRGELLPRYRRLVAQGVAELETTTPPGRLVQIVDQLTRVAGEYLWYLAVVGGSAWKMEQALTRFCREHLAAGPAGRALEHDPQVLLRGLPGAEPRTPPHAVHTIDWYQPTVGELPGQPTALSASPGDDRHARLPAARNHAEQLCRTSLTRHPRRLNEFNAMLGVVQRYAVIREEQARDLTLGWPLLRRGLHRLGDHLQRAGLINDPDDVFFLTRHEITDALTSAAATAPQPGPRRAEWTRQRRMVAPLTLGRPPRLIGDPIARAVQRARTGEVPDGALIGHPASSGRATGPVRVVTSPADFDIFTDGDVLVAKATAPAWTILFGRAAAVVTDGGTLAAHASLVAREYGIPAVVGTGDATTRLHTGQYVTVDGTTGTVTLDRATQPR